MTQTATPKQIEIRADAKRAQSLITLNEWIDLEDGKFRAIRDVLSRFVIDKETNQYMDTANASKILGTMTVEQLSQANAQFMKAVEEGTVPLLSEGG
jgi:hypothetical protein